MTEYQKGYHAGRKQILIFGWDDAACFYESVTESDCCTWSREYADGFLDALDADCE